jgi:hypothetical protein
LPNPTTHVSKSFRLQSSQARKLLDVLPQLILLDYSATRSRPSDLIGFPLDYASWSLKLALSGYHHVYGQRTLDSSRCLHWYRSSHLDHMHLRISYSCWSHVFLLPWNLPSVGISSHGIFRRIQQYRFLFSASLQVLVDDVVSGVRPLSGCSCGSQFSRTS